jgi:hypothetical protein
VSDNLIKHSTDFKTKLNCQIDALHEKHLDEISKVTKDSRQKLSDSVEAFSDRELVANLYTKTLQTVEVEGSPVSLVVEYHKIRKQFSKIASLGVAQFEFHMNQKHEEKLEELCGISKFAKLVLNEQSMKFSFDVNKMVYATLHVTLELSSCEITGGCFKQDGGILVGGGGQNEILLFNSTGECVTLETSFRPNDVTLKDSDVYISCSSPSYKGIHCFTISEDTWKLLPKVSRHEYCAHKFPFCQKEECFSIRCAHGFIYVACGEFILKVGANGSIIKRYATEKGTYSVTVNKNKRIIYSSCSSHKVICLNDAGSPLFRYTHPNLQYPYSLDVDFEGYIYVAGRDSNNIHILSPSGTLLRILEVTKPNFIKLKADSRICLIGTQKSSGTKICEIKVPDFP